MYVYMLYTSITQGYVLLPLYTHILIGQYICSVWWWWYWILVKHVWGLWIGHESKIIEHENLVPIWKTRKVILCYLLETFIIIIAKWVNSQYVCIYIYIHWNNCQILRNNYIFSKTTYLGSKKCQIPESLFFHIWTSQVFVETLDGSAAMSMLCLCRLYPPWN